ncbi:dimethyl sulfoxide reductase anchor subunit family protein [Cytobacillus gottheilii]|uniref:dimethyl sulfoxide reductase anchor subunit family protein n=1 Tax=Cytobacillus gottheilii TaxID=859144 RepID=UPI0009BBE60A|nr:DmsC/YnfH family molybdoenzyme membrane anchor subunit [Cytobacillus gottheilii]
MHEWALLIFTVCLQAAIGGTIVLLLFYKKLSNLGSEQSLQVMKLPLIVISVLSFIGLGASFAHLGAPENAFNTIRHLGSSWMSREILVTGMFIGLICLTTGLAFVQKKVHGWLLITAAVAGLIDVFCMGAIYYNTLVSGWNSINTYTSFYGTVFVLGPVLTAGLIAPSLKGQYNELSQQLLKYAFYISLAGIAIQLVGVALFSSAMPDVSQIGAGNALNALEDYQATVAIRWIIEFAAVLFIGYLAHSTKRMKLNYFAYGALAVLIFAEGMSRYVFYVMGA